MDFPSTLPLKVNYSLPLLIMISQGIQILRPPETPLGCRARFLPRHPYREHVYSCLLSIFQGTQERVTRFAIVYSIYLQIFLKDNGNDDDDYSRTNDLD